MNESRAEEENVADTPPPTPPTFMATRPDVVGPSSVDEPEDRTTITWGVGAVADRLGIAASTLRTWERRYGVGPSHRTQGGHRRYTERDIDRVELLRRLVARGVSAQDAARVARSLDRENLAIALAEPEAGPIEPAEASDLIDAVMAAAATLDREKLDKVIDGALRRDEFLDAWRGILAPALMRIASESSGGSLEAEAADLATQIVLAQLLSVRPAQPRRRVDVVLATTDATADSLPLVAVDAALRSADVTTKFVDAGTPPGAVPAIVSGLQPQVVMLWSSGFGAAVVEATLAPGSSVLRASPAWPHELGMAIGEDERTVAMDVSTATGHVLDRLHTRSGASTA